MTRLLAPASNHKRNKTNVTDKRHSMTNTARNPLDGVGLGLRAAHYSYIHDNKPDIPWFEVLIDNYLEKSEIITDHLIQIRRDYPITFHGVGMSIGSTDPLNMEYLQQLRTAIARYQPVHISDHLCWTGVNFEYAHDLLPLPYTMEAARHVAGRIQQVQDFLRQRILIENVSTYLSYADSYQHEAEFLNEVVTRADCDILLDVNNIYVSAFNQGFDPIHYLELIPAARVKEYHLAGYEDQGTHLLDTHGRAVHAPVWELYEQTLAIIGPRPTLIEWDNDIPEFPVLVTEATKAQQRLEHYHNHAA